MMHEPMHMAAPLHQTELAAFLDNTPASMPQLTTAASQHAAQLNMQLMDSTMNPTAC
jgi:hypothetical protein